MAEGPGFRISGEKSCLWSLQSTLMWLYNKVRFIVILGHYIKGQGRKMSPFFRPPHISCCSDNLIISDLLFWCVASSWSSFFLVIVN